MTSPVLYLVHHGQTEMDAEGKVQGDLETPLTPTGIAEARAAGRTLAASVDIALVISSPIQRARETAAIVADECFALIQYAQELEPWDEGHWNGRLHSEVEAEMLSYASRPGVTVPGGEAFGTYLRRWKTFVERIWSGLEARPTVQVVLVTHGMNIFAAPRLLNGVTDSSKLLGSDGVPSGSLTAITKRNGKFLAVLVPTRTLGPNPEPKQIPH